LLAGVAVVVGGETRRSDQIPEGIVGVSIRRVPARIGQETNRAMPVVAVVAILEAVEGQLPALADQVKATDVLPLRCLPYYVA
jgi:hypothetical protein